MLIADEDALLNEGIAGVLRSTCDIAAFCDGRQMIELAASISPDIIVFDIGMPGLNGLEAARRVHLLHPSILLVCITQQESLRNEEGPGLSLRGRTNALFQPLRLNELESFE